MVLPVEEKFLSRPMFMVVGSRFVLEAVTPVKSHEFIRCLGCDSRANVGLVSVERIADITSGLVCIRDPSAVGLSAHGSSRAGSLDPDGICKEEARRGNVRRLESQLGIVKRC